MDIGDLDIKLRRRAHIERSMASQPRLPGTLRQLGAVGAVTRAASPGHQQAMVIMLAVRSAGTHRHVRYMQYRKGRDQTQARLYGVGTADVGAFTRAAMTDPHQFRLIVATKEDQLGDQRDVFIASLVRQVERDVGRNLDWVAANHYDTPYPHTHVIIRGVANEKALYMAKSYFKYGIQDRADALLTRMLGQRQTERQRYTVDQAYTQERLALNGMVRGTGDPDLWRVARIQQATQSQSLAGQMGSYRQESGTGAVLAQMQQRMQALQAQQQQWQQAQRRND